MKRSEAVRVISDMIHGESFASCEYTDTDQYSDLILTKLEEAGMLPPQVKLRNFTEMYYDNAWEPEDE